jgi:hypothetical protein
VQQLEPKAGTEGYAAMKTFLKYVLMLICFAISVRYAISAVQNFNNPHHLDDAVFESMFAALFLLGAFLLFLWKPRVTAGKD